MKGFVFALVCVTVCCFAVHVCPAEKQHPIIFVPGLFGAALDIKLDVPSSQVLPHPSCVRTSNGKWDRLWIAAKYAIPAENFDCMAAYLSSDIAADGTARPAVKGTEIKAPYFGDTRCIDPLDPEDIFGGFFSLYKKVAKLIHEMGYSDNRTFFAAGYDWRLPPTPEWLASMKDTVEKAVAATGKKAVIMGHSMGCPFSYIFLMKQTPEWRAKYIEHWMPVSPVFAGAEILPFAMITNEMFGIETVFKSLGSVFRHLPSAFFIAPNLKHNADKPVAYVGKTPYTARNISYILEKVGVKDAQKKLEALQQPLNEFAYKHPGVPTTLVYTTGVMRSIDYFSWKSEDEIGVKEPIPHLMAGDGLVSFESLTYALRIWQKDPQYASITEGIAIPNSNHGTTSSDSKTLDHLFKQSCDL